jgi:hypothetical protein
VKCQECGKVLTNDADCYGHDCEVGLRHLKPEDPENISECYKWAVQMQAQHAKSGCKECKKVLKSEKK